MSRCHFLSEAFPNFAPLQPRLDVVLLRCALIASCSLLASHMSQHIIKDYVGDYFIRKGVHEGRVLSVGSLCFPLIPMTKPLVNKNRYAVIIVLVLPEPRKYFICSINIYQVH